MKNRSQILTLGIAALLLCTAIIVGVVVNNQSSPETSDVYSDVFSDLLSETPSYSDLSQAVSEIGDETNSSEISVEEVAFPAFQVDNAVKANYLVLYDATNDRFLFERKADKRCYPASITKLLTALTACDYLKRSDVVTVGSEINMIGEGSSTAYLQVGYQLTFEQLMDSMMIVSGNDAAYVMGVWAGRKILGVERGSREEALKAFVDKMNEKAVSIGMTDTHFTNPDGYHDDNHYTTPRDLALLCKEALKNRLIAESCGKTEARYSIVSGQTVNYKSTNLFLKDYEFATGLKTGTTNEAGFCLAASAKKDGRELIAIIIGADTTASRFTAAASIFDIAYGLA